MELELSEENQSISNRTQLLRGIPSIKPLVRRSSSGFVKNSNWKNRHAIAILEIGKQLSEAVIIHYDPDKMNSQYDGADGQQPDDAIQNNEGKNPFSKSTGTGNSSAELRSNFLRKSEIDLAMAEVKRKMELVGGSPPPGATIDPDLVVKKNVSDDENGDDDDDEDGCCSPPCCCDYFRIFLQFVLDIFMIIFLLASISGVSLGSWFLATSSKKETVVIGLLCGSGSLLLLSLFGLAVGCFRGRITAIAFAVIALSMAIGSASMGTFAIVRQESVTSMFETGFQTLINDHWDTRGSLIQKNLNCCGLGDRIDSISDENDGTNDSSDDESDESDDSSSSDDSDDDSEDDSEDDTEQDKNDFEHENFVCPEGATETCLAKASEIASTITSPVYVTLYCFAGLLVVLTVISILIAFAFPNDDDNTSEKKTKKNDYVDEYDNSRTYKERRSEDVTFGQPVGLNAV